jgi:hypothetical protein
MSNRVEAFPSSGSARYTFLSRRPYLVHLYIAGYEGYLELQRLAGYPENANVRNWYNQAMNLRMNTFSKDTPFGDDVNTVGWYNRALSVARNFMFLTPEIGDYMYANLRPQVQQAVDEYSRIAPYWFVSKFDNSVGEGTLQHLYDSPAIFQAKAYALKQPYDELAKYLDAPAFARGDLFYIQNLVAALSVAGPSVCRDLNGDGVINIIDIMLVSSHMGTNDPLYDFDGNGVVDVQDLSVFSLCWHGPL